VCLLFAATYPERTSSLVLIGSYARRLAADDYPWGAAPADYEAFLEDIEGNWGGPVGLEVRAPSVADDARFRTWWATYLRTSASPGAALALTRMNGLIDVRHALPTISAPTLILHRAGDRSLPIEGSRYLAKHIRGAKLVELSGDDHLPFVGDQDSILDEIEQFLTGVRRGPAADRVLATILFTDIVGSTEHAAVLGDRDWRDLLDRHHVLVRRELERWRGREVDTAGDGFLATFDGPARAIRCAFAVRDAVRELGLDIRAGMHTGECEVLGATIAGIAVHIGARVSALAAAGEVLVSSTVKDLVAGSGIESRRGGDLELKGVPGTWRIYAVVGV
jgi:class 3 adenylate cyclase